jgi:hypothetical protein
MELCAALMDSLQCYSKAYTYTQIALLEHDVGGKLENPTATI